ncbi:MAG: nuclease-related domain-containing protein [Chloroflexota bacterium]|nr:nuclease-related domain-containing protein [Chloroflexota bacterium]
MKIVTNEKLIERNAKIGKYTGFASFAILAGGMVISFKYQEQLWYSVVALIVGFLLSQMSMYYINRWARTPRPDEALDAALKGLDDRYAIYHYTSPTSHLLVGPAGVLILLPYYQKGVITYNQDKKRWKRKGGNAYMNFFAQDSIGRPSRDIKFETQAVSQALSEIPDFEAPPIRSVLVFVHEGTTVEADDAPSTTIHALQLKKFIRKEAKGNDALSMVDVRTIQDSLEIA